MLDFLFGNKTAPRTITIDGRTTPFDARRGETILDAAVREGLHFPNDCRVGGCGTCKCRLLSGKVHERTDKAYVLTKAELRAGYVLACQSVPKTDIRVAVDGLEAGAPAHPIVVTEGVVASRRALSHDIAELTVRVDTPLVYTAGQYARVSIRAAPDTSRSYSFARAPRASGADDELVFYVREVPGGALSPTLVRADVVGTRVRVEGPFGDFRLREGNAPVFAVAGGSGLAPVRALLEGLVQKRLARPVAVLFGARTEADLYEVGAIEALARSAAAPFTFVPVLSHEPVASSWRGARGLVTEHFAAHLDANAEAYLCGSPAMIDAAVAELERFGLRSDRIFYDAFTDQSHLAKRVA